MAERIAVLIPVLDRPRRVEPLLASLTGSQQDVRLVPIFLCSPEDEEEILAIGSQPSPPEAELLIVPWPPGHGDYARKMNLGAVHARVKGFEWVFLGADDLVFHAGWAEAGLAEHDRTGACVVGTNDLGNPRVKTGLHSTHTLVKTEYVDCGTVDADGVILNAGYGHEFADDEFCQTAMFRNTWAFAVHAHVEHLHPDWGKGEWDATYEKGRATTHQDRALYESRRWMWGK